MRDWLDEKLKTPEPDGELLYFNKSNESGKTPVFPDRTFVPYFRKNGERITVANREASAFLFKNGNKGELELSTDTGEFKDGDVVHVVFHYYRDNKPGMDLHKLLTFGAWSGGAVAVLRDLNKNDGAWAEADGIEVAFSATTKQAIIPFTIQSDAFEKYHKETSYFWVKLSAPNLDPAPTDPPFYSQGFWLAG
ncbi:MAG: hypothetical protein FJW30_06370 [Acidobacteria bacterium]|nr:hypothetical protein [Acidobacteriota bacterium]